MICDGCTVICSDDGYYTKTDDNKMLCPHCLNHNGKLPVEIWADQICNEIDNNIIENLLIEENYD